MIQRARHTGILKAGCAIALVAWFMLLAQIIAHAENPSHLGIPSAHCTVCSAGALDDDLDVAPAVSLHVVQSVSTGILPKQYAQKIPGRPLQGHAARAPPSE